MNIHDNDFLNSIKVFIEKEKKDDSYNSGMMAVLQYIEQYKSQYILSEDFKFFALKTFLNNDTSKLDKLKDVMNLFTILNKNVPPLKDWFEGPGSLNNKMFTTFSKVLSECSLTNFSQDWDHEWFNLSLTFTKADGKVHSYVFDSYGRFDKENFDESDEGNYHNLCKLLKIERSESLFIYMILSVAFHLIDENKVKDEIIKLNQPTRSFHLK